MEKRIVQTGLKGNKAKEILSSVLGQMSDGIWENSNQPGYVRWWYPINIKMEGENVEIVVDENFMFKWCGQWYQNPYVGKTEIHIKNFLSRKLKQIVKIEQNDYGYDKNDLSIISKYVGYEEKITLQDCLETAKFLKG